MNSVNIKFRKAELKDKAKIWKILQEAIERRRLDGSQQWQDGYPNPATIKFDIENRAGYVLTENDNVVVYCAIILNDEPAYKEIEGKWLSGGDFYVVHRVAVSSEVAGKGYVKELFKILEKFAVQYKVYSIRVDTNFDNPAMLNILEKLDYNYCGEVHFRGSPRKAFEKILYHN